MIIGFDIGNTNTKLGIYKEDAIIPENIYSYKTSPNSHQDTLKKNISNAISQFKKDNEDLSVCGCAYSSVVPAINLKYDTVIPELFSIKPYCISSESTLSISINYTNPQQLGIDRIVNAEAAFREYGCSMIIIDIGTATTLCILLEDGTFDGGIIAPGIGTTIKSLTQRTSLLSSFEFEKPQNLVAKDTINALKSGFFYGWISLIEGLITRIKNNYNTKFTVLFTGGGSKIIHENISDSKYDPNLIMKGIKYIYDNNKRNK